MLVCIRIFNTQTRHHGMRCENCGEEIPKYPCWKCGYGETLTGGYEGTGKH